MRQIRENLENQGVFLLQNLMAHGSQQPWCELLEKISQGDLSALGSLYQETSPLLFGLILCIVAYRPLAEEILLDVFKQVWRQAAAYDAKRGNPLAWMLAMARRRALSCLPSNKTGNELKGAQSRRLSINAPQTEAEKLSPISDQHHLAQAALTSLSAVEREIIELVYYCGLSVNEIAITLELPQTTIKKHLSFAMMQLRNSLNPVQQEQR